jgi:hypothetical protein
MDRGEALAALDLLRRVVSQARDDTALQNWGMVWIVSGLTNATGFALTNVLAWTLEPLRPLPFAVLWTVVLGFNLGVIFAFRDRSAGARTFFEAQIWVIWSSFIAAGVLVALVNQLLGLEVLFIGPVLAILAAVAFASMGAVFTRTFFAFSAVFAVTALVMASLPRWQFFVFGAIWGVFQTGAGVQLHREKLRRLRASPAEVPRLV